MGKIIGFGGRIGSGKSELAKICQDAGFKKLYFALPLKQLVSNLINVKLVEINELKNVEKDYIIIVKNGEYRWKNLSLKSVPVIFMLPMHR